MKLITWILSPYLRWRVSRLEARMDALMALPGWNKKSMLAYSRLCGKRGALLTALTGETSRQRYLRNHQENIGVMRAAAQRHGFTPEGEAIREMVRVWEQIGQVAEQRERGETQE